MAIAILTTLLPVQNFQTNLISSISLLFFLTRKVAKENRHHTKTLAVRLCTTARDLTLGVV
jgi:hypothetical protein